MRTIHLGVSIQDSPFNHINKEHYLLAKPEFMIGWNEEDYTRQRRKAALNFDLNMQFFSSLDSAAFMSYTAAQIQKHKFIVCNNIRELVGVAGVYMLVLDEFKQIYIGQSSDIYKRIRSHWSKKQSLERLICGKVWNSTLSIDAFGALDTTRVYYIKTYSTFDREEQIVGDFNPLYTLNRTSGGIGNSSTYTDTEATAAVAVLANRRTKDLLPFLSLQELLNVVSNKEIDDYVKSFPVFAKWFSLQKNS